MTQALKAKAGRESLARLLSIQAMAKLKNGRNQEQVPSGFDEAVSCGEENA